MAADPALDGSEVIMWYLQRAKSSLRRGSDSKLWAFGGIAYFLRIGKEQREVVIAEEVSY